MKRKWTTADTVLAAILGVMTLMMVIPFWQIIVIAFSTTRDYLADPTHLILRNIDVSVFTRIMQSAGIQRGLLISLFVVTAGWAVSMVLTVAGGYALSHKNLPGRGLILTMLIISMYFNGGVIAMYVLLRKINVLNSIFVLFLPFACNTFYLLLVKNYIQSLPSELEEAATIDGSNDIITLVRIIIPVCKPVLLTVSMFYIVNYWNDYFLAMMYMDNPDLYPLSLILRNVIISRTLSISSLAGTSGSSPTEQYSMALILVSMLPIIILYPLIQRYFTTGIMMGALKE